MANVIKLKKGLDINLAGKAELSVSDVAKSEYFAIVPDDFYAVVPKVAVKVGDKVEAGTPLMFDKNCPEVKFVSPVSGEVAAVNRGERRKVLNITVKADGKGTSVNYGKLDLAALSAEQLKQTLLDAGMFAFIKQRPYDVIANPNETPRDIFVTAFDSAPLAPDFEYVVKGEEANLQMALDALKKLTTGKVYVGVKEGGTLNLKGVEVTQFAGVHPVGNVGVQIQHTAPINKGETVWTISAFDLLFIGRLLNTGKVDFSRTIAVTGSEIEKPAYVRTTLGASLSSILEGNICKGEANQRIISGNVLTGTKVAMDDYLRTPHAHITVIPEGDDCHEIFGWATPGFNKFSVSRSFFTWMMGKKKEYTIDARLRGGERAIIMSGEYDKVLPMDILAEFLIKATLAFDIDKMENLGIYEVAPEDFALCEFVDTSKLEIQKIIRDGLDQLKKEMN